MSLDTALFLVERDRVNHHVSGANALTVIKHGDRVLVKRGDDIYTTWHSKPLPAVVPYMTRRLTYTREYDSAQGKYVHPSGDGKINLGYDFGTAGNYPAEEWRNVRNQKASFNDLDGELFVIKNSTQYEKDDLVRITHEGGDLEAWYSLTDADWMQFQEHYNDNGRPQANITPVKGTKPSVDDGAILKFEFFKPSAHPFDTIADDDLLLAWENNQSKHVTGANFKALFIPPLPPLGEWNWIGHSTSTDLYKMCDNGKQRWAYFKSDWGSLYFDHVDRNEQTGMHTKLQQSIANGDEIWFKVDNHPAVKYTESLDPVYTVYYCSFSLNYYDAPLPMPPGVIRWYDQNPDAS